MRNNPQPINVGDRVRYAPIIGRPPLEEIHTVQSIFMMCGQQVAYLSNKSGCVSLDALTLVSVGDEQGSAI